MVPCPCCHADNSETSRFCSECGHALDQDVAVTLTHFNRSEPAGVQTASDSSHHGRFLPGTKIADRYRIVSLVGKGGMGEVYRADDLKLGQTVALKFLPKNFADDPRRLEYFRREVRLTRQISHPNVCRVYDIGEVDGQQFLSMEYIDGEDLRVLLRRIGRLPYDKGIQVSQQLCAGLAAAHDQGVLHRDLKPANIMIDGRGHVRITDFGLAQLSEERREGEIAGTPAYMAPEQLTRGQASIQSDLYALGLILSELFTGKQAQKPGSLAELIRAHEESSPSRSVKLSDDVDPAVQRVILRRLEKEPSDRPRSVHAVAAALPGGDPLAAALAAGETPSPEMVAAAGDTGRLSLRTASVCLVITLVGLALLTHVAGKASPTVRLNKSAEASAQQAQDILKELGLYDPQSEVTQSEVHQSEVHQSKNQSEPWDHQAYGFAKAQGGAKYKLQADGEPNEMPFWYRQSPVSLIPELSSLKVQAIPVVTLMNPPPLVPEMVSLRLDSSDKLRELLVVSSRPAPELRQPVSEAKLLELAGLKQDEFKPGRETKLFTPPIYADTVYSFVPLQDKPAGVERVDVAELDGHANFFHVVEVSQLSPLTWDMRSPKDPKLGATTAILITLFAMILAWRNVREGRSDIRGAKWVALFIFVVEFAGLLIGSTPSPGMIMTEIWLALAKAVRFWIYYVALEPLARRFWPGMLIAWSRAVAGRFQDPSFGQGILLGTMVGILFNLFVVGVLKMSFAPSPATLSGTRFLFSGLLTGLEYAVRFSLQIAMAMVLIRALVRNDWLPAITAAVFFAVAWHYECFFDAWNSDPEARVWACAYFTYYAVVAALLSRWGVVSAASFMLCHELFRQFPWSSDWIGPDVAGCVFAVTTIATLALFGFYASVGGHTAFEEKAKTVG